MSFFLTIYNNILVRPLFNILIFFYDFVGDFGVAIILLTILVRLIMYPFSARSLRSQQELAKLQPQVQEIQRRYKGNQTEQSKALMQLYKEQGINPFSGCLPLLVQLPVFLALFSVLRQGLEPGQLNQLYSFVQRPQVISPLFLGLVNLQGRSILLAVFAGLLQFVQGQVMPQAATTAEQAKMVRAQMVYILPIIIFVVSVTLPAGIALYLGVSTAFGVAQQYISSRKQNASQAQKT